MPSFRIVSDVFSPDPWSFTDDKGQTVTLKSYYFEVQTGDEVARKVFLHQKPETDAPKEGDTLEGKITDKQNKKGTHNKFEKDKKYPDLVCKKCGATGPLEDFRPEKKEYSPAPEAPAKTPVSQDDEPPLRDNPEIPF